MLQLPNRLVNDVVLPLRRRLSGDVYATAEGTRAHVEKLAREPEPSDPPARLERKVRIVRSRWREWPVYEIGPKGAGPGPRCLYLHGGAYIHEVDAYHWRTVAELAGRANLTTRLPIYPLVPHTRAEELVAATADLAAAEERLPLLMGDSAGAGLALAATLAMRDRGDPLPSRLVLISPFVDGTVSDPRQPAIARRDKMLRMDGLREAARLYADGLDPSDPRVSPVTGDLSGLPPMTIFTGTDDILDTDARNLADRAAAAGVEVDLRVTEGAPHAFVVMPTGQGARARREIADVCRAVGG